MFYLEGEIEGIGLTVGVVDMGKVKKRQT